MTVTTTEAVKVDVSKSVLSPQKKTYYLAAFVSNAIKECSLQGVTEKSEENDLQTVPPGMAHTSVHACL